MSSPIPEAERVWRPSYVVLYGRDPGAPDLAPEACQARGELEVAEAAEKVYDGDAFRRGAQELGANGVTQFALVVRDGGERVIRAQAVSCPWPGVTP